MVTGLQMHITPTPTHKVSQQLATEPEDALTPEFGAPVNPVRPTKRNTNLFMHANGSTQDNPKRRKTAFRAMRKEAITSWRTAGSASSDLPLSETEDATSRTVANDAGTHDYDSTERDSSSTDSDSEDNVDGSHQIYSSILQPAQIETSPIEADDDDVIDANDIDENDNPSLIIWLTENNSGAESPNSLAGAAYVTHCSQINISSRCDISSATNRSRWQSIPPLAIAGTIHQLICSTVAARRARTVLTMTNECLEVLELMSSLTHLDSEAALERRGRTAKYMEVLKRMSFLTHLDIIAALERRRSFCKVLGGPRTDKLTHLDSEAALKRRGLYYKVLGGPRTNKLPYALGY